MKKIINLSFVLAGLFLASCEKAENKVYFEGGTAPNISASTTAVRLEDTEENNQAIRFNWTNPEYRFNTGISSQNVTYTLEMDTVGGNFNSGAKVSVVVAKDLSVTFIVGDFNKILTTGLNGGKGMNLQSDPRRVYNIEARVSSSIGNAAKLLSTNKVTFTASPFPPPSKVITPENNRLWIVGDATPGGWNGNIPGLASSPQEFTRVNRTLYELTLDVPGGGRYKLLPTANGWGKSYRPVGTTDPLWNEGGFEQRDADPAFIGPPTGGRYKFSFDFQVGTFKVTRL